MGSSERALFRYGPAGKHLTTKEAKKVLAALFDECNRQYFDGGLRRPRFSLYKSDNQYGRYTCHRVKSGIEGHIWISYSHDWDHNLLKTLMIHEMIHHRVKTVEHRNGGLFGHNWRFRRECRRLRREFGLVIPIHFKRIPVNF